MACSLLQKKSYQFLVMLNIGITNFFYGKVRSDSVWLEAFSAF